LEYNHAALSCYYRFDCNYYCLQAQAAETSEQQKPDAMRPAPAVDTDGNGPCASGRGFINNSCLPLRYILKEQVESGAMTVKEWREEMGEWKEYWKKHPEEELHGCTDKNGFDTGYALRYQRNKM
jgi:hypothetical protein